MRQFLGFLALIAVFAASTPSIRADNATDAAARAAAASAAATAAATFHAAASAAAAAPTGQRIALPTAAPIQNYDVIINGPTPSPAPPVYKTIFPLGSCSTTSLPAPPSPAAILDSDGIDPNFKASLDYLLDVCGAALAVRYTRYEDQKQATIEALWSGTGTTEIDYRRIAVATCSSSFGDTLLAVQYEKGSPNGEWRAAQLLAFCAATATAADPPNIDRFFCDGPKEPGSSLHTGGQARKFLVLGATLFLFSAFAAKGGLKSTTSILGTASLAAPALCGFTAGTALGSTVNSLTGILGGAPAAAGAAP